MIRQALESVIVKPVGAKCNLNCDYCFYLEKEQLYPDTKLMQKETLDVLIRQMSEQSGSHYNITWQGGEPCLAGLDFFQTAIDLQIKHGKKDSKIIGNSLQTNGTLLNDNWFSFLKEYNFLIGLSLDGPKEWHDAHRSNKNGTGSWDKVFNNGKKLLKKGLEVNILSCLNKSNIDGADSLYYFFKNEGFQWLQFSPILEYNIDGEKTEASISAKEYGDFLCRIFDLWFTDFIKNSAPSIRFIENAFHVHLGMQIPECRFQKNCGKYLLVEHNGDVYSCDFFVNPENKLGNIHNDRLLDLLNSPKQCAFGNIKENIPEDCTSCRWLSFCHNGCPKYRNLKTYKNHFCDAYKMFHEYSYNRMTQLATLFRKNNPNPPDRTFDASGYFK